MTIEHLRLRRKKRVYGESLMNKLYPLPLVLPFQKPLIRTAETNSVG